jgi:hypothetical protein
VGDADDKQHDHAADVDANERPTTLVGPPALKRQTHPKEDGEERVELALDE